jgi:hypothetical protein
MPRGPVPPLRSWAARIRQARARGTSPLASISINPGNTANWFNPIDPGNLINPCNLTNLTNPTDFVRN